jgi:translocation and assembly module TamB
MTPSIDTSQPSDVSLAAEELRAELLLPFASGVFSQLDGRLTGGVRVQIDPASRTIRPQGTISLKSGTFELAKLGGEFHDATARLVLTPDGVVKLEDATAHGLSGRLQLAATARFNGLEFGGARAVVQIPPRQAMPLVFDGVQIGVVDGRFDIAADRSADHRGMDFAVSVPKMRVQLPTAANHDVQSLSGLDGVDVGIRHGSNDFAPATLDATTDTASEGAASGQSPVKVAVHLGGDVEVQRGTDLDIRLEGDPTVFLGSGEARATGQIRLTRGTLDVEGKRFDIQGESTVTFVGSDADNPQVVLTAGWVAPDGTNVFADFVGPLKTGKVVLRSQPSRSQSEILALILFGTTDEQAPGATSPQATGAAGVAGGAATAPINRALGGVNHMLDTFGLVGGISTKIDTSTTSPRPEVELQIARDISVQIAWVLGNPPPGTNPDTTLLTLSWRFLRQWSLLTTVGDLGTSIVDVIWQKRY